MTSLLADESFVNWLNQVSSLNDGGQCLAFGFDSDQPALAIKHALQAHEGVTCAVIMIDKGAIEARIIVHHSGVEAAEASVLDPGTTVGDFFGLMRLYEGEEHAWEVAEGLAAVGASEFTSRIATPA
ncbi:hypothetical protein [Branchiibius hedensis]|uniref:hypothetical protein n=1 Tax=Branchiibius hedensis TaxID=672460 RepID=UPI000D6CEA0D|nr:hypothetical protein [Branchiibius hedensis]